MRAWGRPIAGAIYIIANLAAIGTMADSPRFGVFVAILLSMATTYLLILVHELGHAGAVVWLRGRVLMLAVGPLAARFRPFRLCLTPGSDVDMREVGGFVISSFDGYETTGKDLLVAIAGPLANLLFAAITAALGLLLAVSDISARSAPSKPAVLATTTSSAATPFVVAQLPTEAEVARSLSEARADGQAKEVWLPWLYALTILSLAAGLANLVPYKGSDGDQVRRAIRDLMEVRRHRARRDAS